MPSLKDFIESNPFISLGSTIVGSVTLTWVTLSTIDRKANENMDKVLKGSYTLNSQIDEKYVAKEKYAELQLKYTVCEDRSDNPVVPTIGRKVMVFEGDSIDYYGILIYQSDIIDEQITTVRAQLKNNGFKNTEIFLSTNNKYYLIVYGFACLGDKTKKVTQRIKKLIKFKDFLIKPIDLTTISQEGFVVHPPTSNSIFQYFKPRVTEKS